MMKTPNKTRILMVLSLLVFANINNAFSHDMRQDNAIPRVWKLEKSGDNIRGYFLYLKKNIVAIETERGIVQKIALGTLSVEDQHYVLNKYQAISRLNEINSAAINPVLVKEIIVFPWKTLVFMAVLLALVLWMWKLNYQGRWLLMPMLLVGFCAGLLSFTQNTKRRMGGTNPGFLDSAFSPFKPEVNTRWDATWFYVDCKGIPAHSMMVGITSWQQQVPLPQCYVGSNAWKIPLNPLMATNPVPVNNQHFLRGAVALAANGVPIFNPYTNTGVDAFLDGQLDNWGGHSGRADDYHYHIAPLFLESKSKNITPIAFALDGFAIYGSKEPDGTTMATLDANHGHMWKDGRYHYHGTSAAPYMIGKMVGVVTEDTTLQIIPQPSAKGVRPALTPLKGATITGFHTNGTNGYTLIYTLSGATDSVVYSWNSTGNFTYDFYTATGKTTSSYKGSLPCTVPASAARLSLNNQLLIYPNPSESKLNVVFGNNGKEVSKVSIANAGGQLVYESTKFQSVIDIKNWTKGVYFVKVETIRGTAVTKFLKQ